MKYVVKEKLHIMGGSIEIVGNENETFFTITLSTNKMIAHREEMYEIVFWTSLIVVSLLKQIDLISAPLITAVTARSRIRVV